MSHLNRRRYYMTIIADYIYISTDSVTMEGSQRWSISTQRGLEKGSISRLFESKLDNHKKKLKLACVVQ